jgi:hypothetical protein
VTREEKRAAFPSIKGSKLNSLHHKREEALPLFQFLSSTLQLAFPMMYQGENAYGK